MISTTIGGWHPSFGGMSPTTAHRLCRAANTLGSLGSRTARSKYPMPQVQKGYPSGLLSKPRTQYGDLYFLTAIPVSDKRTNFQQMLYKALRRAKVEFSLVKATLEKPAEDVRDVYAITKKLNLKDQHAASGTNFFPGTIHTLDDKGIEALVEQAITKLKLRK